MRHRYSMLRELVPLVLIVSSGIATGCIDFSQSGSVNADDALSVSTAEVTDTDAYGSAFIANTFTSGFQNLRSIASCANGDSVFLWIDNARGNGLFTRRYSVGGIPSQRDERLIDPAGVPAGGIGCFATTRNASDGSGDGVYVGIYDRAGNVVIPEFRANEIISGSQTGARVAINASGRFAVTWVDQPTKTIYVKLFQPNGTAVAPAQAVFSSGAVVTDPHVAINGQGAFVVTWDVFATSSDIDVYCRRYSSTGFAVAPAFRANTTTAGRQMVPEPAISLAGDFWVIWGSQVALGPPANWGIVGRHFSASSIALSGEIQIATSVGLDTLIPSVGMAANGNFMVSWSDNNQPSGMGQVLGRRYSSNGTALTLPFLVASATTQFNEQPLVAMDADGNATIAWSQFNLSTAERDIGARRYPPSGVNVRPIADGEIVSNLSGAAGSWQYVKATVPPGHGIVDVLISGSVGDADLYVRYGAVPSATGWDGRPFLDGSNEGVEMLNFPSGDWYIGINGFTAYMSLSLQVSSR